MTLHYVDPRKVQRGHPFCAILRRIAFPIERRLPEPLSHALRKLAR